MLSFSYMLLLLYVHSQETIEAFVYDLRSSFLLDMPFSNTSRTLASKCISVLVWSSYLILYLARHLYHEICTVPIALKTTIHLCGQNKSQPGHNLVFSSVNFTCPCLTPTQNWLAAESCTSNLQNIKWQTGKNAQN